MNCLALLHFSAPQPSVLESLENQTLGSSIRLGFSFLMIYMHFLPQICCLAHPKVRMKEKNFRLVSSGRHWEGSPGIYKVSMAKTIHKNFENIWCRPKNFFPS